MPEPTYGPHAVFIGWMVCTYNDVLGIWEDDWDGVIHEEPFTADTELASARSNGLNACLFELRRARTLDGPRTLDGNEQRWIEDDHADSYSDDEWVNPKTGHGDDCGCISCHMSQVQ